MSPVVWIRDARYRLVELVRHHWGDKSGDQLQHGIDEYVGAATELAELRLKVSQLSARLHKLDPPPPVCRDFGVRFTGD
jgi:hypothetical protein